MNEQLQKALIDLIGKASNGIDASVSFLSAEIPDVIHQLLLWYAARSAIEFFVGVIIISFGVKIFNMKIGVSKDSAKKDYEDGKLWTRYCGSAKITSTEYDAIMMMPDYWKAKVFGVFVSMIGAIWVNIDWLQIWIAPKIWLIEYASQLAK
jgi:hypothetical protein